MHTRTKSIKHIRETTAYFFNWSCSSSIIWFRKEEKKIRNHWRTIHRSRERERESNCQDYLLCVGNNRSFSCKSISAFSFGSEAIIYSFLLLLLPRNQISSHYSDSGSRKVLCVLLDERENSRPVFFWRRNKCLKFVKFSPKPKTQRSVLNAVITVESRLCDSHFQKHQIWLSIRRCHVLLTFCSTLNRFD